MKIKIKIKTTIIKEIMINEMHISKLSKQNDIMGIIILLKYKQINFNFN